MAPFNYLGKRVKRFPDISCAILCRVGKRAASSYKEYPDRSARLPTKIRLSTTFEGCPKNKRNYSSQAFYRLFPLNERFCHCVGFIIGKLFWWMFAKIRRGCCQNTPLFTIQCQFGTTNGINNHPGRVR